MTRVHDFFDGDFGDLVKMQNLAGYGSLTEIVNIVIPESLYSPRQLTSRTSIALDHFTREHAQ